MEIALAEKMLHPEAGEIRSADVPIHDAVFVIAHDGLELQRAGRRKIEVRHLVDEVPLVGRDDGDETGNSSMAEREVHDGWTCYRQTVTRLLTIGAALCCSRLIVSLTIYSGRSFTSLKTSPR